MHGTRGGFWRALGPGLLMAGAAIGVSHQVQSTRAGAVYGFGFLALIVAANVFKYPAFRFGPEHAAATGTSLLEGYRRQGTWALALYGLLTLGTGAALSTGGTVERATVVSLTRASDSSQSTGPPAPARRDCPKRSPSAC